MHPRTDTQVPPGLGGTAAGQVTALYQAYATGLVRPAMLMLAGQQAAEEVVQDAFFGLYRRWGTLTDPTALRRLPARQREAVVPRHCLGLPEDEVAQAMNISRGTVKSASSITATTLTKCTDGVLSPDGRTTLCGTSGVPNAKYGCATYGAAFDPYNTATEKLERDLYRFRGSCAYAESSFVWAGSGAVAIGLLQVFTAANGTSKSTDSPPSWNDEPIFGLITRAGSPDSTSRCGMRR